MSTHTCESPNTTEIDKIYLYGKSFLLSLHVCLYIKVLCRGKNDLLSIHGNLNSFSLNLKMFCFFIPPANSDNNGTDYMTISQNGGWHFAAGACHNMVVTDGQGNIEVTENKKQL